MSSKSISHSLRLVAFLILGASSHSFGFVQSQIIDLQISTFHIENPNYTGCDFFSICEEPEFLSLDYVSAINPGWVSYSVFHGNEITSENGLNSLDIEITNYDSGFLLNGRWGWDDTQHALRYDSCIDTTGSSNTQCGWSWNSLGLKDTTIHINDGDSLYISAFHVSESLYPERIIDLMVGESVDRIALWNDYFGYTTPEDYYATTVPLPAGIYLFLSGLVGLAFSKNKKRIFN